MGEQAWWEVPEGAGPVEVGSWLATCRRALDRVESAWLAALAEWDRTRGWAVDGQLSAVDWLVQTAGMGRATAFDKLRVAHELRRRPLVAAAFAAGQLSYSAVRAITRAVGAPEAVDASLLTLAEEGTVVDVERAVRSYLRHAEGERPPTDPAAARQLHLRPRHDGTTTVVAVLTDAEAAELRVALDAEAAVDGSSADDRPWPVRRADALLELARRSGPRRGSGERTTLHVVVREGRGWLLGGEALPGAELARLSCDAGRVVHVVDGHGAPLRLGRRTPTWTTAQRRAVMVRDGGRCRWPGCERSRCDVHHVLPWERGGRTDVANGVLLCDRHHTLIHRGFAVTGSADGALTFHRPGGAPVGTTAPVGERVARRAAGVIRP